MPAALLLPGQAQRQHDAVPARIHVRPAGHVRADAMLAGDVRVVRGEEVVRPVPRGALLPDRDVVGAVPGGVALSQGGVGAGAVPCGQVLPRGVGHAQELPAGDEGSGGVGVGQAVRMRRAGATAALRWRRRRVRPLYI